MLLHASTMFRFILIEQIVYSRQRDRERSVKSRINVKIPAAAIPEVKARDSKMPTIKNGIFGTDSISFVTIPARYLKYRIEKYTATYLQWKREKKNSFKLYTC